MLEHLSYSSITSYLTCARAWRFHYIDQIETPPTPALVFGSAMHGAIETVLGARATGTDGHDLNRAWHESWESQLTDKAIAWGADSPSEHYNQGIRILSDPGVQRAIDGLTAAVDKQGPMIERKVELLVPGVPVPVIGFIDFVADDGIPCDLKTSSKSWSADKAQSETQSLFYLAALNQAGIHNHNWTFRHVVFVKTKTPQVQVLQHSHKAEEALWLFGLVADVWRGIEAKLYPCNPGCWKCSAQWCEHWNLCRGKYVG